MLKTTLFGQTKILNFFISHTMLHAINSQDIFCSDYKDEDCVDGATLTTSFPDDIYCRGSFSCSAATKLSSGDNIRCLGARACATIPDIDYNAGSGQIWCYAAQSCSDSALSMNTVYCYASSSCSRSTISTPSVIRGYAEYALFNSSVFMNGGNVELFGSMAGYGATLECAVSSSCNVWCKGSGCIGVTLLGDWIKTNSLDNNAQHQLKGNGVISNDQACTQSFNLYQEYKDQPAIVDQGGGSVCCRGHQSCYNVGNITMTTDSLQSLVCSGQSSCQYVDNIQAYSANVICSGWYSCSSATMDSSADIFCSGYYSCQYSIITAKGGSIHCGGFRGCYFASISVPDSRNVSIFLSGYRSGSRADIACNEGAFCRIICLGAESCGSTISLECNGHCDVSCNVETGCPPTSGLLFMSRYIKNI